MEQEEFAQSFRNIVDNNAKHNKDDNNLSEHSCFCHAKKSLDPWWRWYIFEGIVLRDAVRDWFFSVNEPASKNIYRD